MRDKHVKLFFYSSSVLNNDNCLHLIPFHQKTAFNIETVNKLKCMLNNSQHVYLYFCQRRHALTWKQSGKFYRLVSKILL